MTKLMWRILVLVVCLAPAPLLAQTGFLKITADPPGTSIAVDGRDKGTADPSLTLELSPGAHNVVATRPGFRAVNKSVRIKADQILRLRITLTKSRESVEQLEESAEVRMRMQVGTLVVVSSPPELRVFLDGKQKGRTPLKIANYPAGRVRVQVADSRRSVILEPGTVLRVRFERGKLSVKTAYELSPTGCAKYEISYAAITVTSRFFEPVYVRRKLPQNCRVSVRFHTDDRDSQVILGFGQLGKFEPNCHLALRPKGNSQLKTARANENRSLITRADSMFLLQPYKPFSVVLERKDEALRVLVNDADFTHTKYTPVPDLQRYGYFFIASDKGIRTPGTVILDEVQIETIGPE